MGLTAFNKKRAAMAAQGLGGDVTRAQAHYDNAARRVDQLKADLVAAEAHLEAMANDLAAVMPVDAAPADEVAGEAPALDSFSFKELQAIAKDMGLDAGGKKADLVARIAAAKGE